MVHGFLKFMNLQIIIVFWPESHTYRLQKKKHFTVSSTHPLTHYYLLSDIKTKESFNSVTVSLFSQVYISIENFFRTLSILQNILKYPSKWLELCLVNQDNMNSTRQLAWTTFSLLIIPLKSLVQLPLLSVK